MVTWVKAGMGTEGLTGLEQAIQPAEAAGFQGLRIQRMGFGCLPEGQEVIPQPHNMGVGDVFQTQVKGISGDAARLLGAKDTPVEKFVRLLLGLKTLGAHKAIAQLDLTTLKLEGRDHAVPGKGVMHPLTTPLQPAGTIPIQGALKLSWNRAPGCGQRNAIKLDADIAKSACPIRAVVAKGGGNGHGRRR